MHVTQPPRARLFHLRLGGTRERLRTGAWLLIAYPVFAVAAFAGLGGDRETTRSLPAYAAREVFLAGGLLYVLVYLGALWGTFALRKTGHRITAFMLSALPLAYLATVGIFGLLWLLLDQEE